MKKSIRIGFDIGATHMRAIIKRGTNVRQVAYTKTPATKKSFAVAIEKVLRVANPKEAPVFVGISIAGVLSGTKLVVSPNKNALKGIDLRKIIPGIYALKVDNDARAFAFGEYTMGAGRGSKRMLGFTLGTGVGRALIINGKVQKIKKFEYPEKWEKEYQGEWNKVRLAQLLAKRLQPIISTYRPDRIVIGGGVALSTKTKLFAMLKKTLEAQNKNVSVRRSKLGELAAAYGMVS